MIAEALEVRVYRARVTFISCNYSNVSNTLLESPSFCVLMIISATQT